MAKSTLLLGVLALGACESSVDLGDGLDAAAFSNDAASELAESAPPPDTAPAEAAPPPPDASSSDAPPATCAAACDKLGACGFLDDASASTCVADCATHLTPDQISCILSSSCSAMPSACQGDAGDAFAVLECQMGCDKLNFFQCIDPAEYSNCRALCTTVPPLKRDTFAGCTQSSSADCTQGKGCYAELAR
jgi:hypothetical protein